MRPPEDPLVDQVNKLLAQFFPPTGKRGYERYEISYYGHDFMGPTWLSGGPMTPIGMESVVGHLKAKGADVSSIEAEMAKRKVLQDAAAARSAALRESARAKLTPEEIEACHLDVTVLMTSDAPRR